MPNNTNPYAPASYYMITNRDRYIGPEVFGNTVAPGGALTLLMAPVSNPTFSVVDEEAWFDALHKDLVRLAAPPAGAARWVTFFFHGYGLTFDDATNVFPTYFTNIENAEPPAYPGIYVGFDWPSADLAGIGGGQQQEAFQQAKANARQTGAESFPRLLPILERIKRQLLPPTPDVKLAAICHSMGNYAMFEGAVQLAKPGKPIFDQVLCIAAMLAAAGFNDPASATYCQDISNAAGRVTIYYSQFDNVLPQAEKPGYDGYPELGIYGPQYDNTLLPNTVGVNCSLVVNASNAKANGTPPPGIHVSYFYIPEVLRDIALTIRARPAADVPNRTPLEGTSVGFAMLPLGAQPDAGPAQAAPARSTVA